MSDQQNIKQFMVEFKVPSPFPAELYRLIEDHRAVVNKFFNKGKLTSYALASDRSKLWAVFLASSESELLQLIDKLPLSQYMDYDYQELMFHQSIRLLPAMSLN